MSSAGQVSEQILTGQHRVRASVDRDEQGVRIGEAAWYREFKMKHEAI